MASSKTLAAVLLIATVFVNGIESRPAELPPDAHIHTYRIPLGETAVSKPVPNHEHVPGRPVPRSGCRGLIKSVVSGASNALTDVVNTAGGAINDITDSGNLLGPVGGAVNTVGKAAQGVLDDAVGGASGILDDAACGIKGALGAAASGLLTGNLAGGITNAADDVVSGVGGMAEHAVGAVGHAIDSTAHDLTNFIDHL